jgi:hypothetical protein
MKINNLRIGNLVYYNGTKKELGVVTEIKKSLSPNVEYVGLDFRKDIYYQVKDLEEIPITEEWLLKFGFEKDEIIEFYRKDETSSTIIIDFNFVCLLGYSHVKIQTVNQLQNLYFSLTEKELIIT